MIDVLIHGVCAFVVGEDVNAICVSGFTVIVPVAVALKQSPCETTVKVKVPDWVAVPLIINCFVTGLKLGVTPAGKLPFTNIVFAKVDW